MKSAMNEAKQIDLRGRFVVGEVKSNADPKHQERVQIRIPHIYDDMKDADLPWAMPAKQRIGGATASSGSFGVPPVGTDVLVVFDAGNKYSPIYLGSVLTAVDLLQIAGTTYGTTAGAQLPDGSYFFMDWTTHIMKVHHNSGTEINIAANGAMTITCQQNFIQNASGTMTIETTGGDITITNGTAIEKLSGPNIFHN